MNNRESMRYLEGAWHEAMHKPMIHPRGERVLLQRMPEPKSCIILTDAPPSRRFKVLDIGPDVYDLEVGDVVLLPGIGGEQPDYEVGKQILAHVNDIGCKLG